ncbi:metal-dependent transcriptional regulator [Micrococcus sp. IITD107]|uniref:metal-dependent transcriptional regulator n=1 Tax=Micrococcus sp. IITD107 TaxID=3342790 RepID=UPI0035BB5791
MTDLIDTTEMYLRTILELEEEGITPLRARIVERLDHSGPTVSQTVARMERDGLLTVGEDRHLELTEGGRAQAVSVMRKHRLAERLLADVIGLDWAYIHEEACRWEHVMSEQVERRLLELLENPVDSPYGNPIPGLEALGQVSVDPHADPGELLTVALERPGAYRVLRLTEAVQTDPELLGDLAGAGVLPGAVIQAGPVDGYVSVKAAPGQGAQDQGSGTGGLELSAEIAAHIRVVPAR